MLGPGDLVLCSGTLMRAGFGEMVAAAAAGGFSAISLWPSDYEGARAAGLSDADMRSLLADHGLEIAELDPLLSWLPGEDPGPNATPQARALFAAGEDDFFRIADALGARSLNAAQGFGRTLDLGVAVDAFAGLCERAARHDLLVSLEFLPWSGIPDAATAYEIVRRADRDNGGVMVDVWHHFRGAADDGPLRAIPGARIAGVQLNDAPAEPDPDLVRETMQARLVPGEGAIDLVKFVQILDEIGAAAPIGVEVFSDALAQRPPEEVARRVGDAARAVLARARS